MPESFTLEPLEITYYGNSSFKVVAGGHTIYFDPMFLGEITDEAKADVVIVSSANEKASSSAEIEKVLRDGTVIYGPQSVEDTIGPDVTVVTEGDMYQAADVHVTAVPAYSEGSSAYPRDAGYGYEVIVAGVKIYFAGYTDLIPGMQDRNDVFVSILPIGGYEGMMDYRDAGDAVRKIGCRYVVPMLYETDIHSPVDNFVHEVSSFAEVIVLNPHAVAEGEEEGKK